MKDDNDIYQLFPIHVQLQWPDPKSEFPTPEGCFILEAWNDPSDSASSIARAKVPKGITTQVHRLRGVVERYLITAGTGLVTVGSREPERVGPEDVVIIPADTPQSIRNGGPKDLVFYCTCTPRFTPDCYEAVD